MTIKSTLSALAVAAGMLISTSSANAVVFNISYDDTPTGALDGTIVGTGVLSYAGAPSAGFFTLASLTSLSYSVSFTSGASWTLADLATPLTDAGIFVTDFGGGAFGLVFAGSGVTSPFLGSADFTNVPSGSISHEPTVGSGIGCCGGTSTVNLYAFPTGVGIAGDYAGVLASVPEPGTLAILGLGLVGLGVARRRRVA